MDGVSILPDLGIINISCSHASSIVHWKVWSVLSLKCFQNLTDSSCLLPPLSKPTSPLHWIATEDFLTILFGLLQPFSHSQSGSSHSTSPFSNPLSDFPCHSESQYVPWFWGSQHFLPHLLPSRFLSLCFLSDSSCFGHSNRAVPCPCSQHSTSVLTLEPHSGCTPLSPTVASPGNSVCVYMVHHSLSFFPC